MAYFSQRVWINKYLCCLNINPLSKIPDEEIFTAKLSRLATVRFIFHWFKPECSQ
jgi:hypothetical protein